MRRFRYLGEVIGNCQNWPVIAIAGIFVFLGSEILDAMGFDNALWTIVLIAIIAVAARTFIKLPAQSDFTDR